MTEPDALPDQRSPGHEPAAGELRRRSNLQLAAGVLVFLAGSLLALLAAGNLGVAGVLIAAAIEAAAIAWLYRWCEA